MTKRPLLLINLHKTFINPDTKQYFQGIEQEILRKFSLQMKSTGRRCKNISYSGNSYYLFHPDPIQVDPPPDNLDEKTPSSKHYNETMMLSGHYNWQRNIGFIPLNEGKTTRFCEPSPDWIGEILDKCIDQLSIINKAYDDDLSIGFSFCFLK